MPDPISESVTELLVQTKPKRLGAVAEDGSGDSEYCAQTKLFVKTQYAFYMAFQTLVLVLAAAVTTALVIFVIRLLDDVDVTGVVGTVGTLATGAGATYLQTNANKARTRYKDAMKELKTSGCLQ